MLSARRPLHVYTPKPRTLSLERGICDTKLPKLIITARTILFKRGHHVCLRQTTPEIAPSSPHVEREGVTRLRENLPSEPSLQTPIPSRRPYPGFFFFHPPQQYPHAEEHSLTSALVTALGSSSSRVARRSPGLRAAPSDRCQRTTPDSRTHRGMYIFITSTSQYACRGGGRTAV